MRPRALHIETVINGWIVQVGCQHVVFTDMKEMLSTLDAYLTDPEAVEARFWKHAVNGPKIRAGEEEMPDVARVRRGAPPIQDGPVEYLEERGEG